MENARLKKLLVLQQAVTLIGKENVAASLNVSTSLIESWLRGDTSFPDNKLLALAVQLVKFAEPKK